MIHDLEKQPRMKTIQYEEPLKCPYCKKALRNLRHGQEIRCESCGLLLYRDDLLLHVYNKAYKEIHGKLH